MTEKSILIIGGGIAGLAAGCYARMNGYRAKIFEMHSLPGGLCTAWERGRTSSTVASTICSAPARANLSIVFGRSWAPCRVGISSTTRS